MSKALELAAQSLALAERRLESDGYDWSVDADVQLREDAAELRRLDAENAQLRAELETERMRLAACGVVAMSNTPESAKRNREMKDEYWSASCQDVASMVDREMALRAELEAIYSAVPVAQVCISTKTKQRKYSFGPFSRLYDIEDGDHKLIPIPERKS